MENESSRKKRVFLYSLLLFILIIINYFVSSKLINSKFPFTSNISVFLLINLNIILLLILLIVIFRNLAKIFFSRSKGVFGSSLQSKLVIFSIILSVLPVSIVFIFSINIINNSINKWFDSQVEQALKSSIELMQRYQVQLEQDLMDQTMILSKLITTKGYLYKRNYDELKKFIENYLANNRIDGIAIYNKEGNRIFYQDKKYYINFLVDKDIVRKIIDNARQVANYKFFGANQVYWVGTPISAKTSEKIILGALFVYKFVPPSQAEKVSRIMDSYKNYSQIKFFAEPVKNSYKILLVLMTLLVALAGIWGSIVFSRNITEPLSALAEASKKISKGDLDVRLDEMGSYELKLLIQSFNEMAAKLKEHNEQLEKKNEELNEMYKQILRDNLYIDTIFKNTTSAIFMFDENLNILKLNDKGKKLLETYDEQWWNDLLNKVKKFLKEDKRNITFQKDMVKDSRKSTYSITFSKVYVGENEPDTIILFIDDITGILNARKYEIWKEVASRIAHEIKNPLTPIKLNAERILRKLDNYDGVADTIHKSLRTIIDEVNDLYKMVKEFNEFARMPDSDKRLFNLSKLVSEITDFYEHSVPNIKFMANIEDDVSFYGDELQIKRVVHNLLSNSVAAIKNNGEIFIELKDDGDRIILRVRDNGEGIEKGDLDKVFLPYFSKKSDGTGLGLAIVKKSVEEHNGEIEVRSEVGKFTEFKITFYKLGEG